MLKFLRRHWLITLAACALAVRWLVVNGIDNSDYARGTQMEDKLWRELILDDEYCC